MVLLKSCPKPLFVIVVKLVPKCLIGEAEPKFYRLVPGFLRDGIRTSAEVYPHAMAGLG